MSPEKISGHAHWAEEKQGKLYFPSREVQLWSPGSDCLESVASSLSSIIYESLKSYEMWILKCLEKLDFEFIPLT